MRLSHFSENPDIAVFEPQPVRVPVDRPAGQAWLNGPLVWAIDRLHEHLYLFPRECPRIVIWPTPTTNDADKERWFGGSRSRAIAFVERAWIERIETGAIYRYEMPSETFDDVKDVGMWVSRRPVRPTRIEMLSSLPAQLSRRNVGLRAVETLVVFKDVWNTSLHASGIRLRNAQGWGRPGRTHSNPAGP